MSNLAHPGGNATGLATMAPELSAKRLELLHELVPEMSRMAMLWNDTNPSMMLGANRKSASSRASGSADQAVAGRAMTWWTSTPRSRRCRNGPSTAMLTLADPFTRANRQRIVDFAARSRLPAIYDTREFVESGGLISYGPNLAALQRKAALYIDKIFRGANPGDLPVEQPTGFELVVNMKTARALGISIPASILARADQVIE